MLPQEVLHRRRLAQAGGAAQGLAVVDHSGFGKHRQDVQVALLRRTTESVHAPVRTPAAPDPARLEQLANHPRVPLQGGYLQRDLRVPPGSHRRQQRVRFRAA